MNKVKWVDDNIDDILEFGNGKFLSKDKSILIFLSFCMEYKRLHNYFSNQEVQLFNTYYLFN